MRPTGDQGGKSRPRRVADHFFDKPVSQQPLLQLLSCVSPSWRLTYRPSAPRSVPIICSLFLGFCSIQPTSVDPARSTWRRQQSLPSRFGNRTPVVKIKLSVHYRVHSRQILCVGGNQLPFGWSFLSIARVSFNLRSNAGSGVPGLPLPAAASPLRCACLRDGNAAVAQPPCPRLPQVPMRWTPGDVWVWEGEFAPGTDVEYKYVVLEEQSWTRLCDLAAEGLVTCTRPTYR